MGLFRNRVNTPYVYPRVTSDGHTYMEEMRDLVATLNAIEARIDAKINSLPEVVADAVNEALEGSELDDRVRSLIADVSSETRKLLDKLYEPVL